MRGVLEAAGLSLEEALAFARGDAPVDLLVRNCRLVNVLSGEIHASSVAVARGVIVGLEDCEARKTLDAEGRWLCPGLIDGHLHIESTLLAPAEFGRVAAGHGTAAVVADPHEIANVLGVEGVRYMIEASAGLPLSIYYMLPSCVPATHMETAGARLGVQDMAALLKEYPDQLLGLGEMMNFPGVAYGDPAVLAKLKAFEGRPLDGHAPFVSGWMLNAYLLAGPNSDHENTELEESREKLRKGMHLFLREGSNEHNMVDLLPLMNEFNSSRFSLVSDDRTQLDLLEQGHMDHSVRLAIAHGVPPLRAIQAASLNTARHYGLKGRGAVAPGCRADFLLLNDLGDFDIHQVFLAGKTAQDWDFRVSIPAPGNTMRVRPGLLDDPQILRIPAEAGRLRVIGRLSGQIGTEMRLLEPRVLNGEAVADPERDIAKLAVVERHTGHGGLGLGFAQGLGLRRGALASTVAHDSHNLILAGMNDEDMRLAGREAVRLGGGFVVVEGGRVLASMPLPIAGLMSDKPIEEVVAQYHALLDASKSLGADAPFIILSFLALPVIPALKLTDKGLVDVKSFAFTDLWAQAE